MQNSELITDSRSLQLLKNIDFCLRTHTAKTIAMACDYPEEKHGELAQSLVQDLMSIYDRKIFVLDMRLQGSALSDGLKYQAIRDLDFDFNDSKQMEIYLDELSKHNEHIFIILNINKNIEATRLPEFSFDGAFIVRSKKSIGPNKSRYVTNLLKDADIPLLGLIQVEGE